MNKTAKLTQPVKWWGGKSYQARHIIDLMPPHLHYVEPYAGGLAVLLNKDPFDTRHQWGDTSDEQGISEVVNDFHHPLQNFWDVLKDEKTFERFCRILSATPFSEVEFIRANDHVPESVLDVEAAVKLFTRCRQSRTAAFKEFATLPRNRTRRRMNEHASAWLTAIDGLETVHARLKRVVILCRDAIQVIAQQDGPKTLFYLDPPYLHSTRTSYGQYAQEMNESDHEKMLEAVQHCKGSVMLSGYPSSLYDDALAQWNRHDIETDNKASGAKTKRIMTESVWTNF